MSSVPDTPPSNRRIRGTKFYVIRNYWSFAILGVASLTLVPFALSSRVRQNFQRIMDTFLPSMELVDRHSYELSSNRPSRRAVVEQIHKNLESEHQGAVNPEKYAVKSTAEK